MELNPENQTAKLHKLKALIISTHFIDIEIAIANQSRCVLNMGGDNKKICQNFQIGSFIINLKAELACCVPIEQLQI